MSPILEYYRGTGTDGAGRTHTETLLLDNRQLERAHDIIQWWFPLPEASVAQPLAPVATQADFEEFRRDMWLQDRLLSSVYRMRCFYRETTDWHRQRNHNHLRITRILRCLVLCGMPTVAQTLLYDLKGMTPVPLPQKTTWYWEEALNEHPAWLA